MTYVYSYFALSYLTSLYYLLIRFITLLIRYIIYL